jgi:AraC-like DNA-binding protein
LSRRKASCGSLRPDLENAIALLLPHGKAHTGDISRKLGMSQRTLARRLSEEGLTFAGVLEELKLDLAKRYLQDEDLPLSEIAWLLGYREASAFTHIFHRWFGKTPREMQNQRKIYNQKTAFREGAKAVPPRCSLMRRARSTSVCRAAEQACPRAAAIGAKRFSRLTRQVRYYCGHETTGFGAVLIQDSLV